MGLDMYAMRVERDVIGAAQVDFTVPDDVQAQEIFYWRKHPDLHGWMAALYREKGGTDASFNCSCVRLEAADLDALEAAVNTGKLPPTTGFFFGVSSHDAETRAEDLKFIRTARQALTDGDAVYYTSWW